jgi:SAM-dependent methyltransferase
MNRPLGSRGHLAALLVLAAVLAACRTRDAAPGAQPPETSVRPGVNAEYLTTNLNLGQWIERFEREGREIYDQRADVVRAIGLRPGMRVADVGSGTGLFTLLFAAEVGRGGRVFAVDIVPDFLKHIEAQARDQGLGNITTVQCTERSVELPERSIDLAFICDAYHHFEYPHSTMTSLHRALKPGGSLVMIEFRRVEGQSSDWVLNHVRAGEDVFTREIEQAGFEKVEDVGMLKENYFLRFRRR